jgi:hypothetical protein
MNVSNIFPFQIFEEYPKNCTSNRIIQNIPKPKEILLPISVPASSAEEVRQRSPIRNTTMAIKKVWT